jgi:hypothetical protein
MRTLGTLIAAASGAATVAGIPLRLENGVEIRRRISIMPELPGPRRSGSASPQASWSRCYRLLACAHGG